MTTVEPAVRALLTRVLGPRPPAFALLHRPGRSAGVVEVLTGEVGTAATVADIPLRSGPGTGPYDVLAVLPYRQITERGYACVDDGLPLLVLPVAEQATVPLAELLPLLPDRPLTLTPGGFDVADDAYADVVRRVVRDEIGTGEGANFVIRRSYEARIEDYTLAHALTVFRRLLAGESGAYWTFLVHTGERAFVGATPERHISVDGGTAVLNPISGTWRRPAGGGRPEDLLAFLGDRKESDELAMVLDEELKVMGRLCPAGGRVTGPALREMTRVTHTEYFVSGTTDRDPREILHETLFMPTVVGSPLENACRVVARHESTGRGYYSGVAALIGRDEGRGRDLDSAILIRTAEIGATGDLRIGAGATLVRHSRAEAEVAETDAKIAALLAAVRGRTRPEPGPVRSHAGDPRVRAALAGRDDSTAAYWRSAPGNRRIGPDSATGPADVLVVDAEDTFTWMLRLQLRSLGLRVRVRSYTEDLDARTPGLLVLGPGPGDPLDRSAPKIRRLRELVTDRLARGRPLLAVCLSHQVLCDVLGLPVRRLPQPRQGLQLAVDVFGRTRRVGFYNTFSAYHDGPELSGPHGEPVRVSRDPAGGEVYALRSARFASMQFHPESVLSTEGVDIVAEAVRGLLDPALRVTPVG